MKVLASLASEILSNTFTTAIISLGCAVYRPNHYTNCYNTFHNILNISRYITWTFLPCREFLHYWVYVLFATWSGFVPAVAVFRQEDFLKEYFSWMFPQFWHWRLQGLNEFNHKLRQEHKCWEKQGRDKLCFSKWLPCNWIACLHWTK